MRCRAIMRCLRIRYRCLFHRTIATKTAYSNALYKMDTPPRGVMPDSVPILHDVPCGRRTAKPLHRNKPQVGGVRLLDSDSGACQGNCKTGSCMPDGRGVNLAARKYSEPLGSLQASGHPSPPCRAQTCHLASPYFINRLPIGGCRVLFTLQFGLLLGKGRAGRQQRWARPITIDHTHAGEPNAGWGAFVRDWMCLSSRDAAHLSIDGDTLHM